MRLSASKSRGPWFPQLDCGCDEKPYLYGFERNDNFGPESKIEFLTKFRKNFDSKLDKTTARWKASIEAYPDRFTWGTDRWYKWHFDQEVGGLLVEFARTFIGRLDPAVQENFAYKNAQKLLKDQ